MCTKTPSLNSLRPQGSLKATDQEGSGAVAWWGPQGHQRCGQREWGPDSCWKTALIAEGRAGLGALCQSRWAGLWLGTPLRPVSGCPMCAVCPTGPTAHSHKAGGRHWTSEDNLPGQDERLAPFPRIPSTDADCASSSGLQPLLPGLVKQLWPL